MIDAQQNQINLGKLYSIARNGVLPPFLYYSQVHLRSLPKQLMEQPNSCFEWACQPNFVALGFSTALRVSLHWLCTIIMPQSIEVPYRTKLFTGMYARKIGDYQNCKKFKHTKTYYPQLLVAWNNTGKDKHIVNDCPHWGSNQWSSKHQSGALPLSYTATWSDAQKILKWFAKLLARE